MFEETRLLDQVAYGSIFGNEFNTRIIRLRSGVERRNANWSLPLGRYSIIYQNLEPEDHLLIRQAHMACFGAAIGFRFKDWVDYQATAEEIGTGTGGSQELQLIKTYAFGSQSIERNIYKPIAAGFQLYQNGTPLASSLDTTTGLVTFTATLGQTITWTGEFDVPVRFESDRLDYDPVAKRSGGYVLSSDVDLIETRDI